MKKLFALLLCMIVMPVFANIHVETEVLETVLQEHMPDLDSRVPAYREYNSQVRDANGAGIPASGIWYVCKAAGWDIENDAGKQQCVDFADTLLSRATWKFYAVCGSDKGITGGTERCVDNVFYHRYSISDANVTMVQADGLSKEYARIKYSDDIFCSGKARRRGLNDFVQCTSKEKPIYYEFKFDDVSESIDADITRSVQSAICEMYDTKYSDSGNNGGTAQTWDSWDAACKTTDAKLCGKINESMKRFGYATKIGKTGPKSNQQQHVLYRKTRYILYRNYEPHLA